MKRLTALLLITLLLSAASYLPITRDYLAVVSYRPRPDKFGLAWAYYPNPSGTPSKLGLGCYYFHWWDTLQRSQGNCGTGLPFLHGDDLAQFVVNIPTNYTGIVLVFNECDRPDQCNKTPAQMAQVLRQADSHCPNCKWVGPNYSNACYNGTCTAAFLQAYQAVGGQLSKFYGYGFHAYPSPDNLTPVQKLNVFCQNVACNRPIWGTEVGATSAISAATFKNWLLGLANDGRVAYIFGYAPLTGGPPYKAFLSSNGTLTSYGVAFRDAVVQYNNGAGYPGP